MWLFAFRTIVPPSISIIQFCHNFLHIFCIFIFAFHFFFFSRDECNSRRLDTHTIRFVCTVYTRYIICWFVEAKCWWCEKQEWEFEQWALIKWSWNPCGLLKPSVAGYWRAWNDFTDAKAVLWSRKIMKLHALRKPKTIVSVLFKVRNYCWSLHGNVCTSVGLEIDFIFRTTQYKMKLNAMQHEFSSEHLKMVHKTVLTSPL